MREDPVPPEDPGPDVRARETETLMTDEERFALVLGLMPVAPDGRRDERVPAQVPQIAGWVAGVPRLGVPDLRLTDAALGVTNPLGGRPGDTATALPAGLALGSTFDPALARAAGALVGREARSRGFNVLLGGGINLPRDPRHGRNFEYLSEDPWVSAVLAAETVIGTQSEAVVATLKHFSLNSHETNKHWLDAVIDPAAHRESDLLAFEIAIERSEPGTVMTAYNKVDGAHCAGNGPLLHLLKEAFGFRGWVMSDWGAVYGWEFALEGLDQHCGAQLDEKEWFAGPLRQAHAGGRFPRERLSGMVRRILRSVYAVGADRWGEHPPVDLEAHHSVSLEVARQGIVLLDNDGILPLSTGYQRIAVVGGHADRGVLTGGGSSHVTPPCGNAVEIPWGGEGPLASFRTETYVASSPLAWLRTLLHEAEFHFDPGVYPADAAALARRCDAAIVFVTKFECEAFDSPDLDLPHGQDGLVSAVAGANPNTLVVLETGNPVSLPWREQVRAIVQAWYPGQAGGQAIAEVLTGATNPSGRLPITWPASVEQLPRPQLAGFGDPPGAPLRIEYSEGAELGYRWFALTGQEPSYAFGHGLGYTTFAYDGFEVTGGETVTAHVTVTNTGDRHGADVVQLYLTATPEDHRMRLLAFERVELGAGESAGVDLTVDPRLLARYDAGGGHWRIAAGDYDIAVGRSAQSLLSHRSVRLAGRTFGR